MSIQEVLEAKKKEVQKYSRLKVQAETKLETDKEQYKQIEEEIQEKGVDPSNVAEELKKLEDEMKKINDELNELVPSDSVEDYK